MFLKHIRVAAVAFAAHLGNTRSPRSLANGKSHKNSRPEEIQQI